MNYNEENKNLHEWAQLVKTLTVNCTYVWGKPYTHKTVLGRSTETKNYHKKIDKNTIINGNQESKSF
jgi:hypothetical protein